MSFNASPAQIRLARGVFAVTLVGACASAAAALPRCGSMTRTTTAQPPRGPAVRRVERVCWDGNRTRLDQAGPTGLVTLTLGSTVYMFPPGPKVATVYRAELPVGRTAFLPQLVKSAGILKSRGRKVGVERIGRFTCDVYTRNVEIPGAKSKLHSKAWINQDSQLPIAIRTVISATGIGTSITETSAVKLGTVPPGKFRLPRDAKVVDLKPPPSAKKRSPARR